MEGCKFEKKLLSFTEYILQLRLFFAILFLRDAVITKIANTNIYEIATTNQRKPSPE